MRRSGSGGTGIDEHCGIGVRRAQDDVETAGQFGTIQVQDGLVQGVVHDEVRGGEGATGIEIREDQEGFREIEVRGRTQVQTREMARRPETGYTRSQTQERRQETHHCDPTGLTLVHAVAATVDAASTSYSETR